MGPGRMSVHVSTLAGSRTRSIIKANTPHYAGRGPTSSVATGSKVNFVFSILFLSHDSSTCPSQVQHKKEIEAFWRRLLSLGIKFLCTQSSSTMK